LGEHSHLAEDIPRRDPGQSSILEAHYQARSERAAEDKNKASPGSPFLITISPGARHCNSPNRIKCASAWFDRPDKMATWRNSWV